MRIQDSLVLGSGLASGGVPEDLQSAIIQVVVMLVTWGLTRLLDRKKKINL